MKNNPIEMNNNSVENLPSDRNVLYQPSVLGEPSLDSPNIRVLIIDDQKSVCQQLQLSLEPEPGLEVVGTTTNGAI